MTFTGTELMSSFAGNRIDSVDLGADDPRFAVEVSDDDEAPGRASLVFNEPLAFHASYAGAEWAERVGEAGYLNAEWEEKLLDLLRGYLAPYGVTEVYSADGGDYEPNFTVEIGADYLEGETFDQWHERIGWKIIATLINVSDPGTFNAPYWFA